ncbi:MAG: hypothetical protein IRZ16_16115 [Myxococcaceae bacterium]|nr:hypothetical protein [Myxococcaceae bacterium]
MRRTLLFAAAASLFACGTPPDGAHGQPREYDNNDLQLISGYTAKELCSCLFVMERDEDYCRAWTKASPAVANARVDRAHKSVEAGALMFWMRRAHYVDEHFGCVLDP